MIAGTHSTCAPGIMPNQAISASRMTKLMAELDQLGDDCGEGKYLAGEVRPS